MSEMSSASDSGSHGAPSPDSSSNSPSHLKFSIYNILRPNGFGAKPSPSSSSSSTISTTTSLLNFNTSIAPSLDPQNTSPLSLLSAANFDDINDAVSDLDQQQLPAWIYCTRYSDRPSAGPRHRKAPKRRDPLPEDEKRPRTAFTADQLERLKQQFHNNRYLTEKRRQELAHELGLNESQIKIWFQNKRAKLKKANLQRSSSNSMPSQQSSPTPNPYQLMAQNLYNRLGLALK